MIIYIEKGKNMHKALADAGLAIHYLDGDFVTKADVLAVNDFIAAYNPLIELQAEAVAEIKAYAQKLIYEKLPQWKQANLTAASLSLIAKPARGLGDLTQAELDQVTAIEGYYAYPLAIRAQSDIEEAAILAETDWTLIDVEAAKANLDAVV